MRGEGGSLFTAGRLIQLTVGTICHIKNKIKASAQATKVTSHWTNVMENI